MVRKEGQGPELECPGVPVPGAERHERVMGGRDRKNPWTLWRSLDVVSWASPWSFNQESVVVQ